MHSGNHGDYGFIYYIVNQINEAQYYVTKSMKLPACLWQFLHECLHALYTCLCKAKRFQNYEKFATSDLKSIYEEILSPTVLPIIPQRHVISIVNIQCTFKSPYTS